MMRTTVDTRESKDGVIQGWEREGGRETGEEK